MMVVLVIFSVTLMAALSIGAGRMGCFLYACFINIPLVALINIVIGLVTSFIVVRKINIRVGNGKVYIATIVLSLLVSAIAIPSMDHFNYLDARKYFLRQQSPVIEKGLVRNDSQIKVYENRLLNFRFSYPSKWGYSDKFGSSSEDSVAVVFIPNEKDNRNYQTTIEVYASNNTIGNVNYDGYQESSFKGEKAFILIQETGYSYTKRIAFIKNNITYSINVVSADKDLVSKYFSELPNLFEFIE